MRSSSPPDPRAPTLEAAPGRTDVPFAATLASTIEGAVASLTDEPATERYQHVGVLGEGGMGRVFEVRDLRLGRTIALKELSLATPTVDLARRFAVEALVTANLEHPGIVPVYERGVRHGRAYYTMRKLSGRNLAETLARTADLSERLALVPALVRVADAVGYAHARGVVHRDLKPSNVVLGEFGEVTVIDWGIAKIADGALVRDAGAVAAASLGAGETLSGALLGTPAYMAPEQAAGRNDEVDARSDVYALGAMFYEILAGRPLYEGPTAMAVVAKALEGAHAPLAEVAAAAPVALREICERALRRDRSARYATASELARALENAINTAWLDRGSSALRIGIATTLAVTLLTAAFGGSVILGRLPAFEALGFGRYPIFAAAALALGFLVVEAITLGRHGLGVTSLVFIALTLGSGVMGASLGMLSIFRMASDPAVLDDARRWRELLTVGGYESLGNFVLGLAASAMLTMIWEAVRRGVASRQTGQRAHTTMSSLQAAHPLSSPRR